MKLIIGSFVFLVISFSLSLAAKLPQSRVCGSSYLRSTTPLRLTPYRLLTSRQHLNQKRH
ncbi:hypothetical protein L218DRAFT_961630 [Marasmius fiardii PR-910]|nr:hypothetical protein L218DRAFT_961630 [Marasmius fiardii PR-910]